MSAGVVPYPYGEGDGEGDGKGKGKGGGAVLQYIYTKVWHSLLCDPLRILGSISTNKVEKINSRVALLCDFHKGLQRLLVPKYMQYIYIYIFVCIPYIVQT